MSGVPSAEQNAPLRESDFADIFDATPTALLLIRAAGLVMDAANQAYLAAVGMPVGDVVGHHVFDVFPNSPIQEEGIDQATDLRSFMQATVDSREPQRAERWRYDIPDAHGGFDRRWWNVIEVPVFGASGDVRWILHYTEDVTALVEAQQELYEIERARDAAEQQVASLAEVALALTTAQSPEDLEAIVVSRGLAVLGSDGGGLISAAPDGRWRVIASETLGAHVQNAYGWLDHDSPLPGASCARTGERLLLPTRESGLAYDPVMAQVYADTGRHGWAFVPLTVQGENLGCLAVAWVDEHEFTDDELDVIDGFAAQCAQALHRIQLADAQRLAAQRVKELAEALQRSMLTPPPQTDTLHMAVRYRPAVDGAQVGGDWYDAFAQPDGAMILVIGDVAGHDSGAAAKMGQLRGLLRALAYNAVGTDENTPAGMLTRLERSARGLDVEALATAVVARVGHSPDRPGALTLQWSNAGNPPPVLVEADGTTRMLDPRSDLLLGVGDDITRHDLEAEFDPGATLLMYTDGLIERRKASIDAGIADLRAALSEFASASPDELCDGVLERLAPHTGEDDIALIAVRAVIPVVEDSASASGSRS